MRGFPSKRLIAVGRDHPDGIDSGGCFFFFFLFSKEFFNYRMQNKPSYLRLMLLKMWKFTVFIPISEIRGYYSVKSCLRVHQGVALKNFNMSSSCYCLESKSCYSVMLR